MRHSDRIPVAGLHRGVKKEWKDIAIEICGRWGSLIEMLKMTVRPWNVIFFPHTFHLCQYNNTLSKDKLLVKI